MLESTTYKFAKSLRDRFGVIEGITDKDFVTNSYHVFVKDKIDPFEKIAIENDFQKLSTGGAISYIESADLTQNIPALLEVVKYIYDAIMYCEINTKSDYCSICGSDKEIKIVGEPGHLHYKCEVCGNEDDTQMHVARRVCGYISTVQPNSGRLDDIQSRFTHLSDVEL